MYNQIKEAADYIKGKLAGNTPEIGIVLGSGLGEFADQVEDKVVIPYSEIPHFHQTTVKGHQGRIVSGHLKGKKVIVFQGRFHRYEGHSMQDVVLPVRVVSLLGAKNLILTNAAGGMSPRYTPGELVVITDHINLTGDNPLIGPNIEELGERFPDMSRTYNPSLNEIITKSAKEINIKLETGIYIGVLGPSYETPAEIQMFAKMGADMVGMSTVAEAIAAHHAGLKVCGISCITNFAAGMGQESLNHDEVKEVANQVKEKFTALLLQTIHNMEA